MRQHGTRPARKDSRHQSSVSSQLPISDGISTLMHSVQPPCRRPATHRAVIEAKTLELIHRHNAMLPSRQFVNEQIDLIPRLTGRFRSLSVLF